MNKRENRPEVESVNKTEEIREDVKPKLFVMSLEDAQRLQGFRLLDDDFMRLVFEDNVEATELLLNIIFDRYDMKVLRVISQRQIKNPSGHSVQLDIYAVDAQNHHYDIEIQREDKGAGERRARFHSSILDTKLLMSGKDPKELPDSYVIFITENDVRKRNRPFYSFHRHDDETKELFQDGSHIIYVNGAYKSETDRIGRLMHDFRCVRAEDMYYPVLADKVRYFKETEGGRETVCKVLEDMRNEAEEKGRIAGKIEERASLVQKMHKKGKSIEEIADCFELSVHEVEKLVEEKIA